MVSFDFVNEALRILDSFPLVLFLVALCVSMPLPRRVAHGVSLSLELLAGLSCVVRHVVPPLLWLSGMSDRRNLRVVTSADDSLQDMRYGSRRNKEMCTSPTKPPLRIMLRLN